MTNEEYQEFTQTTNYYPPWAMRNCLILGLVSEAGEVAGKLKKLHRGDYKAHFPDEVYFEKVVIPELGDVLWYISELCNHMDVTISDVMAMNVQKLTKRLEADTIKGDGDDR